MATGAIGHYTPHTAGDLRNTFPWLPLSKSSPFNLLIIYILLSDPFL